MQTATQQRRFGVEQDETCGTPHPVQDIAAYLKAYARQKPEVVAIWCFAAGFVLGWKLKPW